MAAEGVVLRDATQAGMLVVTMTHKMLFDEASVFGSDQHEMYHVARVLVDSGADFCMFDGELLSLLAPDIDLNTLEKISLGGVAGTATGYIIPHSHVVNT